MCLASHLKNVTFYWTKEAEDQSQNLEPIATKRNALTVELTTESQRVKLES